MLAGSVAADGAREQQAADQRAAEGQLPAGRIGHAERRPLALRRAEEAGAERVAAAGPACRRRFYVRPGQPKLRSDAARLSALQRLELLDSALPVRDPAGALQLAELIRGAGQRLARARPSPREHQRAVVEELHLDAGRHQDSHGPARRSTCGSCGRATRARRDGGGSSATAAAGPVSPGTPPPPVRPPRRQRVSVIVVGAPPCAAAAPAAADATAEPAGPASCSASKSTSDRS